MRTGRDLVGRSAFQGATRNSGLTLLELLIALAVFAVLAVMAYGGLKAVLDADQATKEQAEALARLQWSITLITGDLDQVAARPIRDAYGDNAPALDGRRNGYLEWSRAGWVNPAGQLRSDLQRVAYGVENGRLVRIVWYVLDRAQDSEPQREVLMEDVKGIAFRMLDRDRAWREIWPASMNTTDLAALPRAVEIVLTTERWGEVRRLLALPGGG